ncbi:MAG: ferrous iron transport protein B [Epulopiscium sp.]|nr:ferrous iron transport protein B [Candidatus Epulonipiscium sp.]
MGLTIGSVGSNALDRGLIIEKLSDEDKVIALAGNPNVGKSTVFNGLTGLRQHTGNWPGKTVTNAQGIHHRNGKNYIMVDIPGTYSLLAHSAEEEVARDFICFGDPDAVVVVCDATCLERNLNLVLQTIEITKKVVVCVNLMDEARKKGIHVDIEKLSQVLGVPTVGCVARDKKALSAIMDAVDRVLQEKEDTEHVTIGYPLLIEAALEKIQPMLEAKIPDSKISYRWMGLKLLEYDEKTIQAMAQYLQFDFLEDEEMMEVIHQRRDLLFQQGIGENQWHDRIVSSILDQAEAIANQTVTYENQHYHHRDRKIDRILTSRSTGFPIMLGLLCIIFWITISGANVPSSLLAGGLFWLEDRLVELALWAGVPTKLYEMLIFGVYRVLAWVISVMLPPMAIFFPLFTLLEDLGYLPRVAFNLDKTFQRCCACGKQALTMAMGFGCNAAGIIGCRIIDSPRERMIAILTNNFVPCNGRFPTLIAIITMFFASAVAAPYGSVFAALFLTFFVLLGIGATFFVSAMLSKTILKGHPSSFALELPPYRRPQVGKILVHSIFDRTIFVLGRAIMAAAPAGLIIWLFANTMVGEQSILAHCNQFLDPFARQLGLDGVILFAFILGLPANEIVIPIMIMSYLAGGSLMEFESITQLKLVLLENGWTWVTAVCTMLFSLMHWPCATTCLTIRKETGSFKWVALSFLIPTVMGMALCFLFSHGARLFL